MIKVLFRNILFTAGLAATLLSCSSSRHFHKEDISAEGLYGDTVTTDSVTMADMPWQELMTDPYLKELIEEGLKNNPDLKSSIQNVLEAEAYLSQSKASFWPSLSLSADGDYIRYSKSVYPTYPTFAHGEDLKMSSSWEVDIWGKLRGEKRAAYANLLSSDAGRKAVQTRLISNIASSYYSLLALDRQLAITRQTVKTDMDLVETMKALKDNGQVTGAAVVQSEASRYAAEVTIPDLEQQITEMENTIDLLLGRNPGIPVERGTLADQRMTALIRTGVPSQLLDNRPDVMQAEYAVISAYETTNSARAYFYPALTITASGGFESVDLSDILKPENLAINLVGGLTQPIFNKKANATRLKVAKAQQEEALLSFRSALLNAGSEVQNALSSYQTATEKMELRMKQLEALNKSVSYTKELLIYGSADYTEVLTAQQSLLAAQLNDVDDHLQQLNAVVTLYRSLGGGWK